MDSTEIEATKINSVTTRTIWGALMQTCQFAHFKIPAIRYISMNERLEILKDTKPGAGQWPFFQYWVIGDKGHVQRIDATDQETYIDEAKHDGDNAAPFRPIPFVMRPEGSDLTEAERRKYILRKKENINNVNYWCYYGMRIPGVTDITPTVYRTTVVDGASTTVEYETSTANIYPQQKIIAPDQSVTTSSDTLSVSAALTIEFTPNDAQELLNVARIKYNGNEKRAVISEIGLCTGLDTGGIESQTDGGAPIVFNEAISVWIAAFISTFQSLAFNNKGFKVELEMGATEPVTTGTEVPTDQSVNALNTARLNRLSANGFSASVTVNN